jgi:hypothetical protein
MQSDATTATEPNSLQRCCSRHSKVWCPDAWVMPLVNRKLEEVMSAAQTQAGRTRFKATAAPHSGDFLQAVSCSAFGTRLDEASLSIAVALRIGAKIRAPHLCVCVEQADSNGTHGLACRKSAGRHMRKNAVNDLIKRALVYRPMFQQCSSRLRCVETMESIRMA